MTKRQPDHSSSSNAVTYAALAVLIFVWASNFSAVKFALREFEPLAFNGLRFTLASLLLWLVITLRGREARIDRRHWPALIGLGVLGNTIYQVFFVYGIDWTLAGNASLMLATTPVFTTLLSAGFRQERIALMAWSGVALSFVGIVLVVLGGRAAVTFGADTVKGDLAVLAAAAAWSAYTVGSNPLVRRYGPLPVTAVTMWIGCVGLVIVSLPVIVEQDWSAVGAGSWLALIYSGAFAIALAYFIWYYSIRAIGNTRTAVYSNLIPVVALVIAWLTLGEQPTWLQLAGAAGIVAGTILVRLGRVERAPLPPAAE
ncbi:MAG: EamA family transporter [Gemmatimonadetes bacterium]|uniref:EamA family transporter n=1 Tax=Candidatus Kutchimonas denitrificans TaxID=3056748 RepID=A0AAE4ZBC4_9BACT|nr:EamA family transporter [Gemmatimonadota bacterium]NIR76122.1 EamA family transporter [Candidatus Kutchimonas denitrificans]NIS00501.1 EamA family transporter [Gemmatimonadota bacterium]NIT66159.1 EamA family transporter [Gemmatimonadota bacterium]NIU54237.1 EamA family transporter [Gemmatimonadota bacterium]